jgi:hypothetical protein
MLIRPQKENAIEGGFCVAKEVQCSCGTSSRKKDSFRAISAEQWGRLDPMMWERTLWFD